MTTFAYRTFAGIGKSLQHAGGPRCAADEVEAFLNAATKG